MALDKLGRLLAIGHWLKIKGAVEAFDLLLENKRVNNKIISIFNGAYDDFVKQGVVSPREGYIIFEQTHHLHKKANTILSMPKDYWQDEFHEIVVLMEELIDSDRSDDRNYGYKLWLKFIDELDKGRYDLEKIVSLNKNENDFVNQQWILELVCRTVLLSRQFEEGERIALATLKSPNMALSNKAFETYLQINIAKVRSGIKFDPKTAMEILKSKIPNMLFFSKLGELANSLIENAEIMEAKMLLLDILQWGKLNELNTNLPDNFSKRFYFTTIALFEKLSKEEILQFINIIRYCNEYIAKMLVQSLNRRPTLFNEFATELKALVADKQVGASTKETINSYFSLNSRVGHNEPWVELYEFI
jgi:hypothetical protein